MTGLKTKYLGQEFRNRLYHVHWDIPRSKPTTVVSCVDPSCMFLFSFTSNPHTFVLLGTSPQLETDCLPSIIPLSYLPHRRPPFLPIPNRVLRVRLPSDMGSRANKKDEARSPLVYRRNNWKIMECILYFGKHFESIRIGWQFLAILILNDTPHASINSYILHRHILLLEVHNDWSCSQGWPINSLFTVHWTRTCSSNLWWVPSSELIVILASIDSINWYQVKI